MYVQKGREEGVPFLSCVPHSCLVIFCRKFVPKWLRPHLRKFCWHGGPSRSYCRSRHSRSCVSRNYLSASFSLADKAGNTNLNQSTWKCGAYLLAARVLNLPKLRQLCYSFLMSGHGKMPVDEEFAKVAKAVRKVDLFHLEDIGRVYNKLATVQV